MPREYSTIQVVMVFLALGTFLAAVFLPRKQVTNTLAQSFTVQYTNTGFSPQNLTIQRGDTVTFSNVSIEHLELGSDPHPLHTNYPPLNLGHIPQQTSKSMVFNDVGNFGYHNHLHPEFFGRVIVNNTTVSPTLTPTNTPTPTRTPTPTATSTPTPTLTPTNAPKLGDANGDGQVNGADFVIWSSNYGRTTSRGYLDADFNSSGLVEGVDFAIWLNRYGT